ncbi:MAG: hypothetical protein HYY68_05615, partial [Thaumarchaeota archaeon]|nr:hypothetical protein [Nitrososphaerota archaeon]
MPNMTVQLQLAFYAREGSSATGVLSESKNLLVTPLDGESNGLTDTTIGRLFTTCPNARHILGGKVLTIALMVSESTIEACDTSARSESLLK